MSIVIMTQSLQKTPLAFWLFMNGLSARSAAPLFRTNRTTLTSVANGASVPSGQTRDLLSQALLGEMTVEELRALAGPACESAGVSTSPGKPAPGGESIPPGGFSN